MIPVSSKEKTSETAAPARPEPARCPSKRAGAPGEDHQRRSHTSKVRAKTLLERGMRCVSSLIARAPFPQPFWTSDRKSYRLEMRTAGKNNGGERRENQHHTLHGEKTPFVELVWSPPIPLVMEERCPLRSFQC